MTFPLTSLIDNFNRADENPLFNGTWNFPVIGVGGVSLQLVSNQVKATASGANGSYWLGGHADTTTYVAEVWYDIASVTGTDRFLIDFVVDPGLDTSSYYELQMNFNGTDWRLRRSDSGTLSTVGSSVTQTTAAGASVGASLYNGTFTAYYKPSGGSWGTVFTRSDSTYTDVYLAIGIINTNNILDNVGCGFATPDTGPSAPTLAMPLRSALRW